MLPRLPLPPGLLAAACALAIAVNASADVKGRAYGCYANIPSDGVYNVTNCDTGWLDPLNGGSRSSYKNNIQYGTALRVDHMQSESHGDRCKGHSGSSIESGYIMKGRPGEVTWTHMESADEDTCCHPEDVDDIASVFVGLTFGGKPVVVTGQPNQTLTIPGVATLILNERRHDHDDDCDDDDGEHHSMHWIQSGPGGGEVILGATKFDSDDDCCRNVTPVKASTWGNLKASYR
jgi:hypothetical protein